MKVFPFTIVVFLAAMLASCSGTRNLTPAQLDLPESMAPGVDADSLTAADMRWWEVYADTTLRYIISESLEHNRDIQTAAARVEELGKLYGVQKLNYMPQITGIAGATRETNDYYGEKHSTDPELSLKATLNWEIDLWGGLSQSRRKAAAEYHAGVLDRRAMQMTLVAECASAYFNLVALQSELNIVRRTLTTRSEALDKAQLRFEGGLTSELPYRQAVVEYNTTAALIPDLERRIAMARNALTLLMGRFPDTLELTDSPANVVALADELPDSLPLGIPSGLLERRPDIQAAEQRLKSAMAACGVAYSNQFPKLRIAVTGGWENDELAHFFHSPFTYLLGNITGTIFDFGRNRRRYQASIAAYDQARLKYEKTVLTAFTEVSNAVTAYSSARLSAERRRELRDAAYKYVSLANKQYIGGSISYLDVLDAQRRYFDAQISYANAVRDRFLALAALYKALGGGC
ncbi:MAG: efflux transporter outer membrane subunit [Muribaculaceae bacterium]|nr:efflux transporter outer membrane subunit [Muribaculaceae bacterium]